MHVVKPPIKAGGEVPHSLSPLLRDSQWGPAKINPPKAREILALVLAEFDRFNETTEAEASQPCVPDGTQ